MNLRILQRTILLGIVLFSFQTPSVVLKNKTTFEETYKDIILKSKNLALQNDRIQALSILLSAFTKESPRTMGQIEIKRTFGDLSRMFFSDRAQQIYELAISMRRTDIQVALNQILDAQRLEPDNFLILNELVRLKIVKGDCSGALKELSKYSKFKVASEELLLSHLQVYSCLGNTKNIDETKLLINSLKPLEFAGFWKELEIELAGNDLKKIGILVEELAKIDPNYPEIQYWKWKIEIQNKKNNTSAGANYLLLCKNLSSSKFRQYMMDPNLCKRVQEVEKSEN